MRTKLSLLALVAAATLFTGCQTRTASASFPDSALSDAADRALLGGRIGLQVAANARPATLSPGTGRSQFANVDERAYLVWKSTNRS